MVPADSVINNICGKEMEIVVVDSDNLKNIEEEVKRFSSKTENTFIIWYRVEKMFQKVKIVRFF